MGEILSKEFITADEEAEFFDIQDIGGAYRAKITLPAQDANEINNLIHYCNQAWDEERQIYLGYSIPTDDLPRKARITNITDSTTFDKGTNQPQPMMTLTVILSLADKILKLLEK